MILNGTVIGQSSGRSAGTAVYSDVACYAGANQSDGKYVYILKFKTPDFKGVFEKLNLSLYIKSNYSKTITLRYALATSDANRNSYRNTTAAVTEEYQLESGTFPFDGISTGAYNTITMSLNSAVKANTEYYLYLWGYNNTSCLCTVGNISYHSIEVEYTAQTYIDSVSAVTLGGAVAVKFTPPSVSFAYKLKFSIGSWSSTTGVISPKTTAQYTHTQTIPLEVANQITGSPPSGTMTVTLYSYLDSTASTQVGTADSKTFTATVPDNAYTKPAVSMTLSLVNTLSAPFNAFYIQNLTKLDADINAEGMYGASIESCQMTVGSNVYGEPYQTDHLTMTGDVAVTARAVDSRGFVGKTQQTIYVIPYAKPAIIPAEGETRIVCVRCDEDGSITDSGTYLKIKAKRSYSPVISDGEQYNFCQIRYRCNGGSWVTILAGDDAGDEIDIDIPDVVTSTTTAYTIELGVIDDLGYSAAETIIVPSDQVEFHLREGGNGAAFGEYAQEANVLAVAESWELKVKGALTVGGSIGGVIADYIVERGVTSDNIWYQKWNSGKAELWGMATINNEGYFQTSLPFELASGGRYVLTAPHYTGDTATIRTASIYTTASGTCTSTLLTIYARSNGNIVEGLGIDYLIIAKWK